MKKVIVLAFGWLLFVTSVRSQPMALQWGKSFGNANGEDGGNAVCIDKDRNVFLTGTFKGTVDFDPSPIATLNLTSTGTYSAFVAKFDSVGNLLWAKSFGGTSYANPEAITTDDSGNVVTTGTFFGTVDFDPSGATFSLASIGTGGGIAPSPAASIFVQKLNSDGEFIWAIRIGANSAGSAGSGSANAITMDVGRNIYVAGQVAQNGTLDFDPGPGIVNNTTG